MRTTEEEAAKYIVKERLAREKTNEDSASQKEESAEQILNKQIVDVARDKAPRNIVEERTPGLKAGEGDIEKDEGDVTGKKDETDKNQEQLRRQEEFLLEMKQKEQEKKNAFKNKLET